MYRLILKISKYTFLIQNRILIRFEQFPNDLKEGEEKKL